MRKWFVASFALAILLYGGAAEAFPDRVAATLAVGEGPQHVAISPDGRYAYVTNSRDDTVTVLNLFRFVVEGSPVAVGNNPFDVAVTTDGSRLYVSNRDDDTIGVIQLSDRTQMQEIEVGNTPLGILLGSDNARLYVAESGSNTVSVIDTGTNEIDATVSVGSRPYGLAIDRQENRLFVSNRVSDVLSVLDADDLALLETVGTDFTPTRMAVTPDGSFLLVAASESNVVDIIRLSDLGVEGGVVVGSAPRDVAITPDGRFAYVTNGGTDDITIINLDDFSIEESSLSVGESPRGVAVTPDGRYVLVVNEGDDSVSVVTESPFITISSLEPSSLNGATTVQSTLTWSSDQPGSFQVEVGGDGNKDSGVVVVTGTVQAEQNMTSIIQASHLTQGDGAYEVFVHVTGSERGAVGRTSAPLVLDTVPPPAPTDPKVELGGSGILTVSWSAAADQGSGISRYKVYFGTSPGIYDAPGSPFEAGDATQANLTGLVNGTTYFVAVSAVDGADNEGPLSTEVSGSPQEVEGATGSGGGCFIHTVGENRNPGVLLLAVGLLLAAWLLLSAWKRKLRQRKGKFARVSLILFILASVWAGASNSQAMNSEDIDLNFDSISWSIQAGYLIAQGERIEDAYDGGFIGELNLTWMNASNFETSVGVGFVHMEGSALDANGKTLDLDARLWYVPADVSMRYRFQMRKTQKIIPYIDAGFVGAYYQEEIENRERDESGWTYGYQGSLGCRLDMSILAPHDTADFMRAYRTKNVFLFLEGRYSVIDRFGKEDFDLGGIGIMTGVEIKY
jgi:YVTN family beta-propeller protein